MVYFQNLGFISCDSLPSQGDHAAAGAALQPICAEGSDGLHPQPAAAAAPGDRKTNLLVRRGLLQSRRAEMREPEGVCVRWERHAGAAAIGEHAAEVDPQIPARPGTSDLKSCYAGLFLLRGVECFILPKSIVFVHIDAARVVCMLAKCRVKFQLIPITFRCRALLTVYPAESVW